MAELEVAEGQAGHKHRSDTALPPAGSLLGFWEPFSSCSFIFLSIFMQWFGFYKSGQAKETIPLQETSLYKEVSSGSWGFLLCPLFTVPGAPQLSSCHSWGIASPARSCLFGETFPSSHGNVSPFPGETQGLTLVGPAWLRIPLSVS